jgi:NAD-dependent deacetylase
MNVPPELVLDLQAAGHVVVLTGAGISAESGVPTFREAQTGLWARYRPEELATPRAFQNDPRTVLKWYQWRRSLIQEVEPNPGHSALAELEGILQEQGNQITVLTQNIDSLHHRAGNTQVVELHGNIFKNKCASCQAPAGDFPSPAEELPRCEHCGGLLRPDVVWFGEALPASALQTALQVSQECDIFFSIGTSAVVEPAASLPRIAKEHGAVLVEINPVTTPISALCDYQLPEPAGEMLPALLSRFQNKISPG